uniref:Uncharacterized protein n=1 Tax=Siphoviridae sp. cteoh1 TaxID=2826407 RepID=A0A8S5QL27_9CAUD|nr:MAG TPA: hypothetical protein [Siphoviridae sp. cteoh1]
MKRNRISFSYIALYLLTDIIYQVAVKAERKFLFILILHRMENF